jgi:hypothetical protein
MVSLLPPLRKTQHEMVCDSAAVLCFGKHRGESFAAAYGDRRYVDWVLTKKEAARGQFLEFCEFCESAREREAVDKGVSAPRKRKAAEMSALESTGSGSAAMPATAATGATAAIPGPGPREAAIASALTDLLHEIRRVRDELPSIARDLREARAAIASANV